MRYVIDMNYWRGEMKPWPTEEQFKDSIYGVGNEDVSYGSDINANIYVECKIKPKDMPDNGIKWIEE